MRVTLASLAAIAAAAWAVSAADGYQIYVLALVGLTTIVGVGLNILLGLTGQISLGHVGFYAIGAYAIAILTTGPGWSFWPALVVAALAAGVAGALLAVPALRVKGPYLAMVTIAFGFVVEQGAVEWKGLTGGWNGLMNIPAPAAFGVEFADRETAYLVLALTVLAIGFYAALSRSPWGQAMRAIRDSELAGQSIGLNPVRVRTLAFALSAVLTGLAGGVFAVTTSFISPESFPFFQSILFLLVVMIGGADTVLGPLIGAVIVVLLPELLSGLAEYRLLFVGVLLLLVLRLAPEGIVGLVARLVRRPDPGPGARPLADVAGFLANRAGEAPGLSVRDLSISFGGVRAIRDLSFAARPGEITSLIGPNGAGKTTAFNLVCGFYRPDSGSVRLGARELAGLPSHAIARAGIARTYQTTQLFAQMSVLENVALALRKGRLGPGDLLGADATRAAELAESLLAFVGYTGPVRLPAGAPAHIDRRLVEIARALATRPDVLLLDEPAAGLGAQDTERLGRLLRRVAGCGIAVVLVEHDMDLVMGVSDRVVVLDAGAKIADGAPEAVRTDPTVLRAYLGQSERRNRARPAGWRPAAVPELTVAGLSAGYGAASALMSVDLDVKGGELVCVLGANGAGKSTLMRALGGLHRPVSGEIRLDGREIEALPAHRVARAGLVLVPEGRQVFPELSVADNLRLGGFGRSDDLTDDVERLLDRFPRLRERRQQKAGLLSGGEQQMLAIARGLMARPKLLLMDEPSLGLAPALIDGLYDILAELRDEGATILLVDQMAALALSVADRAYVLQSGRVVHSGPAQALNDDAALERAYLGGG